jgi:subfamily B ATP-binding cassette protein MsbA
MRQAVAAAATNPIVQMFAATAVAVVIYVAQVQSASGQITVGSFVSFITALLMLLSPLRHLADVNAPLQRGLAAAESVFQLLDEAIERDEGKIDAGRVAGHLVFRDVSFRYPGPSVTLCPVSISTSRQGKLSLWSASPAVASRPWLRWCRVFTAPIAAPSCSMAMSFRP